jgi:hypothetical protein
MGTIEAELRCPAPRATRLRPGARRRFAAALTLFLLLGGMPLIRVVRQIRAFQTLQREGYPADATVLSRSEQSYPAGIRFYTLQCIYASTSGRTVTAAVVVPRHWWLASTPGSRVILTVCDEMPGYAALGGPRALQLADELGLDGSVLLILGLAALLIFGACLRPYFRDIALVSLGCAVPGRVVGKSWRVIRRCGWKISLPMIHLQFRDPYGVERVRTQVVDRATWNRVQEQQAMTVLVCARRRGWFAAYPLLLAEAVPPVPAPRVAAKMERS